MKNHASLLICTGLVTASVIGAGTPAAKPQPASHDESTTACIGVSKELRFKSLSWITVAGDGNLVACDRGADKVFVISPAGETKKTIDVPVSPAVVCMTGGNSICVAGTGKILVIGPDGTIAKTATAKEAGLPADAGPTGIAASGDDLFIAYCQIPGKQVSGAVYRLGSDLTGGRQIASGYRGCCGNLAIGAHDGKVYIAENAGHRVVVLDREGKVLKRWGKRSRTEVEGFASCCNPMALCIDRNGTVYTSESGPNRIKRYSTDGTFLGLVGVLGKPIGKAKKMAASCSNTAVAVSADGSRVYVIDEDNDLVRVLLRQEKSEG